MATSKFIEDYCYTTEDGGVELTRYFDTKGQKYGVLLLSKEEPLYLKRLAESILNLCGSVLQDSIRESESGLHPDHIITMRLLGRFCGYYVGSTSWEDNKIKDFDKLELTSRLHRLIQHIERS